MITHLDYETRSAVDIKRVGGFRYAAHPSTEIIAIGIAQGDGPVQVVRKDDVPAFAKRLAEGGLRPDLKLCAHNAPFEYAVSHYILHLRHGAPSLLDPRLWDCTLARAAMCGYPQALEHLAAALKLPAQKDLEGRAALMKICKPTGFNWLGEPEYNENPDLYEAVYKYNGIDVETERAADRVLPQLQAVDRKIFELDLIINMRGMRCDTAMARAASKMADELEAKLDAELRRLTNGAVTAASRVGEMKRYVASLGVTLPTKMSKDTDEVSETLDKAAVNDLIADPKVPQAAKDVLMIRAQAGKTSTAKYAAMLDVAGAEDERLRGQYQYWGAGPGRWAGRGVQPHNLPKSASAAFPDGVKGALQGEIIADIMDGNTDAFYTKYGPKALSALSGVIRGAIVPAKGKILVQADLNAIEVRVLFWLAGEASGLAMYEKGHDIYVDMARAIYRNPNLTKAANPGERDLGKRAVLGCGYGVGVDRFIDSTYEETAKLGRPVLLPRDLAERAVKAYRDKYRTVVNMWYSAEKAAIAAVRTPGTVHHTAGGKVHYAMSQTTKDPFLLCRLPSGRIIFYLYPRIGKIEGHNGTEDKLYYLGVGKGGTLREEDTWGGKLVENFTQGVARDVLAHGMLEVEKDGLFAIVLHSHDELLVESNADTVEHKTIVHELERRMTVVPPWATGLPLKAEGWSGYRYRK